MAILRRTVSEFLARNPAIDAASKVLLAAAFVTPLWIISDPKFFKYVPEGETEELRIFRKGLNERLSEENSHLRQENDKLRMKARLLKQVSKQVSDASSSGKP